MSVWQAERIDRRVGQSLEKAHQVITQVADRAPIEAGQPGGDLVQRRHWLVARHLLRHDVQRVLVL